MKEFHTPAIIEVSVPLPLDTTFHYSVPPELSSLVSPGKRVLVPFGGRKLTGYITGAAKTGGEGIKDILAVLDPAPLFTPGELEFFSWAASYYLHPLGEVIKAALPAGINITSRKKGTTPTDGPEDSLQGGKRVKTEIFYRAADPLPETALREKPARIVEYMKNHGEQPAQLLRHEFCIDGTILKRLEEKGYLESIKREVYRDPFKEEVFRRDTPPVLNPDQDAAFSRLSASLERGAFAPFLLHGVTGSGKTEVY